MMMARNYIPGIVARRGGSWVAISPSRAWDPRCCARGTCSSTYPVSVKSARVRSASGAVRWVKWEGASCRGTPPTSRGVSWSAGKGEVTRVVRRAHLEIDVGSLVEDLAQHRILLDEAPFPGAVLLHALAERLLLLVGPLRWSGRRNWRVSDRKSRETRRKGWGIGDYARTREAGKAGEGAYLGLGDAHDQRSGRATGSGGRAAPHTVEDPNRTWERILEAGKIGSRAFPTKRRRV